MQEMMNEIMLKYSQLDAFAQREVRNFIDFLLFKKETNTALEMEKYKQKILQVSVWSEEDERFMQENAKKMNTWRIEEW